MRQLITDFEDLDEVNKQLDIMGYNIGIRLVDEFLAKTRMGRCSSFKETAEVIAKQAFLMFINVNASITNFSADGKECSLVCYKHDSIAQADCNFCKQTSAEHEVYLS